MSRSPSITCIYLILCSQEVKAVCERAQSRAAELQAELDAAMEMERERERESEQFQISYQVPSTHTHTHVYFILCSQEVKAVCQGAQSRAAELQAELEAAQVRIVLSLSRFPPNSSKSTTLLSTACVSLYPTLLHAEKLIMFLCVCLY